MPSFTAQVPNLKVVGPVMKLRLSVGSAVEPAFRASGTAVPTPIPAVGMIDTGATVSVMRQGFASRLGLSPVGVVHINTPMSTNVPCYEYLVRIDLPGNVVAETTVLEAPLLGQHIQCLVGRDVLAHGVLIYIGYENLFSLSF